jgi:hypothetical protein
MYFLRTAPAQPPTPRQNALHIRVRVSKVNALSCCGRAQTRRPVISPALYFCAVGNGSGFFDSVLR